MNDNFNLYREIKDFSYEILDYTNNVPRSLCFIKEGLQDAFIEVIKLVRYYVVNINETSRIKIKYLKDLVVELAVIDFYLEYLYNKKVLGKNRFKILCFKLESIRKLAYGVISSEKK